MKKKSSVSRKLKAAHFWCMFLVDVAAIFGMVSIWVLRTWKNLSMDELVMQLSVPNTGTSDGIILSAVLKAGIPATLIILFVSQLLKHTRDRAFYQKIVSIVTAISVAVIGVTNVYVWQVLAVGDYLDYQSNPSTFIEENYVDPDTVNITFPQQKRNLVYIYLESMEITYSDQENGGGFQENAIPELTQIAEENEDFSGNRNTLNGAYALPYTTFTMGALFGMTSGLPLKNNLENNDMVTQSRFFADTTCLGDILEENGYHNVFLLGSDAEFGGRKLYFTEHGNYDIRDYTYAKDNGWMPSDYYVWWGFEDSKLLSFAKEELKELSQSDQPFNLTLLTVDTHFEDGYICDQCPDTFGNNQYANVIACSSKQIGAFLAWMKTQSWYENTTVIICGDHPTMDGDFCKNVDPDYQRRAYVSYINSAVHTYSDQYRTYCTLDAFPTTLAALGATVEGERLGLGTNLYTGKETLLEQYGLSYVTDEIQKRSDFMTELADIDFSNEELKERQAQSYEEDHTNTVYGSD